MSWDCVSLLTKFTRAPRVTVMVRGLTALFAIVIVGVPASPAAGDGAVGAGDGPLLLFEPPQPAAPKAITHAAIEVVRTCISSLS
jgi:hypothetical protein